MRDDNAQTSADQKTQNTNVEKKITSYLKTMNISESLYEDMRRISPTKIKYLTNDELERYGLNQPDPDSENAKIARIAAALKITSGEYIERAQRAEQTCTSGNRDQRIKCRSDFLSGVTK